MGNTRIPYYVGDRHDTFKLKLKHWNDVTLEDKIIGQYNTGWDSDVQIWSYCIPNSGDKYWKKADLKSYDVIGPGAKTGRCPTNLVWVWDEPELVVENQEEWGELGY